MNSFVHILIPIAFCMLCAQPLGEYMARIYTGKQTWLHPALGWLEAGIYKICRIDPRHEMHWLEYFLTLLGLTTLGFCLLYLILVGQEYLPMNPHDFPGLSADLAFNTAISFVTHTSWQSYHGEGHLGYFAQSAGVITQNFIAPASSMAVAVALFRGLKRRNVQTIGNLWADVVRGVIYILLPLSFVFALFLASQGVVQTIDGYTDYQPLQPLEGAGPYVMAKGPVASHLSIKVIGSNGGGFFDVNSGHPYANPTPFTNMACYTSILLLPIAFIYCFGVMVGDRRQYWSLLGAMTLIFIPLALYTMQIELAGNPTFDPAIVNQADGNMEGKDMRIGAADSALWGVIATATSSGAVNSSHDSYMPLAGMVPLMLIQFGEVIYGGVGSGAMEMIIYVLVTVFLGGLMVGRTPEYLGKKLGPYEIKMIAVIMLVPAVLVLGGTAIAVVSDVGRSAILNPGPQGFTEILYAFSSVTRNNGSAFAGLNTDMPLYNIMLGACMLLGRYWVYAAVLALAGALARKPALPDSPGTLPTHTPLFTVMLVGVIILLDVLTYAPALALGPMAEHASLITKSMPLP